MNYPEFSNRIVGTTSVHDFLVHVIEEIENLAAPIDPDLVSRMLIGDRDYLLLWLRQTTIGDRVDQVMRCPNPGCAKKVDVEFFISELPVHRVEEVRENYEFELSQPAFSDDPASNRGSLRLPTGQDQAFLAQFVAEGEGSTNTRLFSRIVLRMGKRAKIFEEDLRAMPLRLRQELAEQVRRVSPGPDLRIDVPCPHCGADMTYPFDLRNFFLPSWP